MMHRRRCQDSRTASECGMHGRKDQMRTQILRSLVNRLGNKAAKWAACLLAVACIGTSATAWGATVTTEADLRTAIAAGGTVELGEDITLNSDITVGKELAFDLNGHTLNMGKSVVVTSSTLTVQDSSTDGTGSITSSNMNGPVKISGGSLILESGTIQGTSSYAINCASGTITITINGGTLKSTSKAFYAGYGINCSIVINNVTAETPMAFDSNIKSVTINGGTFNKTVSGDSSNTLTINDGTFKDSVTYATINDGTFSRIGNGNKQINGGTFTNKTQLNYVRSLRNTSKFVYVDNDKIQVLDDVPKSYSAVLTGEKEGDVVYFAVANDAISAADPDANNGYGATNVPRHDTVTLYASSSQNKALHAEKGESLTIVLGEGGSYSGTVSVQDAINYAVRNESVNGGTRYTVYVANVGANLYKDGDRDSEPETYVTVKDAQNAAKSGDLIVIARDMGISDAKSNGNDAKKNWTVDLNGKTIGSSTDTGDSIYRQAGTGYTQTIIDSDGNATVTTGAASSRLLYGYGVGMLDVYGGTWRNDSSGNVNDAVFYSGQGTTRFYGGTYIGLNKIGGGTVLINYMSGTDRGNADNGAPKFVGDFTISSGTVTITDGYFTGSFSKTGGTLTVNGGYFTEIAKNSLEALGLDLQWDKMTKKVTIDDVEYIFYHIKDANTVYVAEVYEGEELTGEYATLADAVAAAQPGDIITLLIDITVGTDAFNTKTYLYIDKAITIDGGEHSITSNQSTPILVTAANVILKNTTLKNSGGNGSNAVQVEGGTLTASHVNIECKYYGICFKGGAANISDSVITGYAALYLYGPNGCIVDVSNSVLNGVNSFPSNATSNFGTIVTEASDNCTITLTDCIINASTSSTNLENPFVFSTTLGSSSNNTIYVKGDNTKVLSPEGQAIVGFGGRNTNDILIISGGIFSAEPEESYIVDGYVAISNTDEATKESYPWAIGKAPQVTHAADGTVTIEDNIIECPNCEHGITVDNVRKAIIRRNEIVCGGEKITVGENVDLVTE